MLYTLCVVNILLMTLTLVVHFHLDVFNAEQSHDSSNIQICVGDILALKC